MLNYSNRNKEGKFVGKPKVRLFCLTCGAEFWEHASNNRKYCSKDCFRNSFHPNWLSSFKKGNTPWNKGIHMTSEQKRKLSDHNKRNNVVPPSQWKGNNVGYNGLHAWLRREFGLASRCDNSRCEGKSNSFGWALIRGKKYERKRENFIQLCYSCHNRYDKDYRFEVVLC